MLRALVACAATACVLTSARAQPATCTTDDQCQKDFYCDRDGAFMCHPCLNCEQLKRMPPREPVECIKSVAKCGSCIAGLVEDFRGDVNLECVLPDARGDDGAIPAYVWVIVSVGLLLFAAVVVIVVYVLRNTYTFKILASTRASVQSPCVSNGAVSGAASAPELPPPYYAHYNPVRPESPHPPHSPHSPDSVHQHDVQHNGEESSRPFIERKPSGHGESYGGARQSAGNQSALVFSNPHYVRGPFLPPGYESGVGPVEGEDPQRDESDDELHPYVHDEETVASTWTPAHRDDDNNIASSEGGTLSAQLAAARNSSLLHAPHATPPCHWQDSNNNRNASESLGDEASAGAGAAGGAGAGSSAAPSFIINVMQTINTLQQAPNRHDPSC